MTDELMLDSMGPSAKGGFEIKTHAGGPETADTLLFIADSMRATLDEYEAENYLEMEVKASDGKRYIMTLQRAGKITPHQARLNAEEALEAAKPRTITTAEELDALASEVVILDANHVPREGLRGIDGARNYWRSMGPARMLRSYEILLPATVLYEPQP